MLFSSHCFFICFVSFLLLFSLILLLSFCCYFSGFGFCCRRCLKAAAAEVVKASLLSVCNAVSDAHKRQQQLLLLQRQHQRMLPRQQQQQQGQTPCCSSLFRQPRCLPLLLLRDGFLLEAEATGLSNTLYVWRSIFDKYIQSPSVRLVLRREHARRYMSFM